MKKRNKKNQVEKSSLVFKKQYFAIQKHLNLFYFALMYIQVTNAPLYSVPSCTLNGL